MNERDAAAMAFLEADKLRNIHLLKMLAVYPEHARLFDVSDVGDHAVLVRLPVAVAGYDREHYPDARWIGVISAKRADLARQVIERALASSDRVPGRWVFKCMDAAVAEALRSTGVMTRATSFLSFTGAADRRFRLAHAVQTAREPDETVLDMLVRAGGYGREEVLSFFGAADGRSYWIGDAGEPQAVCMSFALHDDVYEIAALCTRPECRRLGYAQSLVQAAWRDLHQHQRLLRYQTREDNEASIRLARTLGLSEFLCVEHWLLQRAL
jgi:ribosomal protein S18 acetylase RimI-like enzyme